MKMPSRLEIEFAGKLWPNHNSRIESEQKNNRDVAAVRVHGLETEGVWQLYRVSKSKYYTRSSALQKHVESTELEGNKVSIVIMFAAVINSPEKAP